MRKSTMTTSQKRAQRRLYFDLTAEFHARILRVLDHIENGWKFKVVSMGIVNICGQKQVEFVYENHSKLGVTGFQMNLPKPI